MPRNAAFRRMWSGLLGGIAGTTTMTVAMAAMHRRLPPEDRHPLPPRHVSMSLASKTGVGPPEHEADRTALTMALHYGYGTTLGAVYGLLAPETRWAPIVAGLPFGFGVWAGSYLGLLPALGLHPPATSESALRNSLMIAAHFIWAGTIASVVEAARSDSSRR